MEELPKTDDKKGTEGQVDQEGTEGAVEGKAHSQSSQSAKSSQLISRAVFKVGDLVRVTTRDSKENKVHATPYEGIVISFRGAGDNKTFTVRRIGTMKVAIERIFPLNSPAIENIKVVKDNPASRAKLYYLRKKKS